MKTQQPPDVFVKVRFSCPCQSTALETGYVDWYEMRRITESTTSVCEECRCLTCGYAEYTGPLFIRELFVREGDGFRQLSPEEPMPRVAIAAEAGPTETNLINGYYFYRESDDRLWRLLRVHDELIYAKWIVNGGPMEARYIDLDAMNLRGPYPADEPAVAKAMIDNSWRLLREEDETVEQYESGVKGTGQ
jgi:hypothetical protein